MVRTHFGEGNDQIFGQIIDLGSRQKIILYTFDTLQIERNTGYGSATKSRLWR